MIKAYFLSVVSLFVASSLHAQIPLTEEQVVEYSKSIDVSTLDPSLPSQRLEDWLRSGPPHAERVGWLSDDTCDNKPDLDSDYPRCARVSFERGGQSGYLLVRIGTRLKGIVGPPQLYEGIGVQEPIFVQTGWTEHLSGVPALLDQPVVTGGVSELYQAIVARHPIGIPTGTDKAVIWPLLSRHLRQELETAQACYDDYRQHAKTNIDPKPTWLRTGLFVGEGKRVAPLYALAASKQPAKDGSFEVHVNLTYVKVPGFVPEVASWQVSATVVSEDNHFVVDDVRLFDGLDTSGPSHLLSETFAGCDGPKWTGEHGADRHRVAQPSPHFTDWDAVNVLRGNASEEEISFAKALDVHQLDPLLRSQRLEDWLRADALHVNHIDWNSRGCNITEGRYGATPNPEGGLCADVFFQRGNAFVEIKVRDGGNRNIRAGKLEYIKVTDKDARLLTLFVSDDPPPSDSDRLSDLPRLLDQEGVIDVVRNLYDIIVESHPLGIPQTDAGAKILPLLSARLRQQLQNAQACEQDFLNQSTAIHSDEKPVWSDAGLFSGEVELAVPGAELIDHKEQQDDGSFRVIAWLSRKDSAPPNAAASAWINWHVSVAVRAEDARFVIDDVRMFAGTSDDSPPHLLTDFFRGCDGPRWVGLNSGIK